MPRLPKNKIEPVKQSSKIKASLKLAGRFYEAEGETFEEVCNNLKVGNFAKGVSVLTIEKDGVKREKILTSNHTQNLFGMASPTMKGTALKWVKVLYGIS